MGGDGRPVGGGGGGTKPDKTAACSAPERLNVNGSRITSGIIVMAARPHTAASRSPCHLSSSSNYLDTPIIAREYDNQSMANLIPGLYRQIFFSFTFENRKEVCINWAAAH